MADVEGQLGQHMDLKHSAEYLYCLTRSSLDVFCHATAGDCFTHAVHQQSVN